MTYATDIRTRAMAAWVHEFGDWIGDGVNIRAEVVERDDRQYVCVIDRDGLVPVVVYRLTTQAQLRRMRRPPKGLL